MENNSNAPKIILVFVIIAIGVPIYLFHGSTLERKRKNAITNASKPWAAETLYNVAWSYAHTGRREPVYNIYIDWLCIYGGDSLILALSELGEVNDALFERFRERAEEIEDYADDDEYTFKLPRINTSTAHKDAPRIVLLYAYELEEKLRNGPALDCLEIWFEQFPDAKDEQLKEAEKFYKHLKAKTF